jgi:hypothetical protein
MSAALCAVGTLVTDSFGLPCRVAGIGMWAIALGWIRVGSGHSLFSPLVYILTSWLGFSVDECPHRGMGEASRPCDVVTALVVVAVSVVVVVCISFSVRLVGVMGVFLPIM